MTARPTLGRPGARKAAGSQVVTGETAGSQAAASHAGAGWGAGRLPAGAGDRLLAAALLGWALFDVPWWWRPPGHAGSILAIAGTTGLAVVQSVPFLWRRQQPTLVLAVAAAALGIKAGAHLNPWSAAAAVLAGAYGLGAYGGRAPRLTARLLAVAAVAGALVALQAGQGDHTAAVAFALLATALVVGEAASSHRDAATAAAGHVHDAERASLARDVHDTLAHQLSAIAVQAGAARLASAADPGAATAAVAAIEQEARSGLSELNRLIRDIRQAGPGLGDLPDLVERTRRSGVRAALKVSGQPRPLAAEVELVGYRIVQESLTNSIRYAPGATATVSLRYRLDGIAVEVTDDGPGQPGSDQAPPRRSGPGGGTGLAGLRERACLLGGSLRAGTRPEGGFAVRAFLPDRP